MFFLLLQIMKCTLQMIFAYFCMLKHFLYLTQRAYIFGFVTWIQRTMFLKRLKDRTYGFHVSFTYNTLCKLHILWFRIFGKSCSSKLIFELLYHPGQNNKKLKSWPAHRNLVTSYTEEFKWTLSYYGQKYGNSPEWRSNLQPTLSRFIPWGKRHNRLKCLTTSYIFQSLNMEPRIAAEV